ncbi:MAG TPA: signal peptide peptidase SppA [Kofleriaceae bacterium]|nr:signal peptide peptidase SppA [Kofleriaceae bacterium]
MLGILWRLIAVNLIGNLLAQLANLGRLPRLLRRRRWIGISLHAHLAARPGRMRRLFARPETSLAELGSLFDKLGKDRHVEGVVVRVPQPLTAGWARLATLRAQVRRLQAAGKRVIVHLSGGGVREYYLATCADQILADESAPLGLTGVAAEVMFFAGALAKVGARAELEYRGRYKSFAETFTRKDMSEAQREATDALLDRVHGELCRAVAKARAVTPELAAELLAGGPYMPAVAAHKGLIDDVRYADEIPAWLGDAEMRLASPAEWRRGRLRPLHWRPLLRRRAVRIISLHGTIVAGEGGELGRPALGAGPAARALDAARRDRGTAAVVLHVDSRGGSAQGSDLIWRQAVRLAADKPVVAYFDDVAASGGYYLSCAATKIVCQPLTLTGSIGVVGGKLEISGLLERAGIGVAVMQRGEAAGMDSASRPYSEEERRRLAEEIEALYRQFVDKVAAGRKLPRERAEAVAQGRVWSGLDAREHGLVDELGDVEAAIELAKQLGRRRPGERLVVRDVRPGPRSRSLLARWLLGAGALALPPPLDELAEGWSLAGERALLLPPVTLRWR